MKQLNLKPVKFGCIAPVEMLSCIPKSWNFHLILAHLLEDPKYVEFYKKRKAAGDILLLDNSAFEFGAALNAELILKLIDDSGIEPDYVVAPDYPGQPWQKTWESTLEFIEQVKDRPFKVMGVPQSEVGDWEGWLEGYRKMIEHPDIAVVGMSILAIPNAFQNLTGTKDILINRVFATQYIIYKGLHLAETTCYNPAWKHVGSSYKWHHYLGLGQPRELLLQRQLGLMDSNDSSSPIWHAVQGVTYDDSAGGLINGKSKVPVDFHVKIDEIYHPELSQLLVENLQWIANITGNKI